MTWLLLLVEAQDGGQLGLPFAFRSGPTKRNETQIGQYGFDTQTGLIGDLAWTRRTLG